MCVRMCMCTDIVGQWTWIDPGAFALVGAGAFMGGVTRLTVALAVITVEISSDVHMLLPVLVAIMTVSETHTNKHTQTHTHTHTRARALFV